MRAVSPKRAAQLRIYYKRRAEWIEDRRCECPNPCSNRAEEVHHRAGRDGWRLLDESKWSALCGPCHAYWTRYPDEAVARGISEKRHGVAS